MTRSRRTFTAQEKAAVVKRYLIDKIPVSDLCDELGLPIKRLRSTPIDAEPLQHTAQLGFVLGSSVGIMTEWPCDAGK